MSNHGTFVWNHLVTPDQKKSGDFYAGLLSWSRQEVMSGPFGVYTLFQKDGRDVAGMMNPTIEFTKSRPASWYPYVAVDDVDALAARASQLGGSVIEPPHDVPHVGRVCILADPTSAVICLITPMGTGRLK